MNRNQHTISRFALRLALIFSVFVGWNTNAQTNPVQATVVTTQPFLNYLSYYGDQNNHLQITLTQLDFFEPPMLVRLRLRFEGLGWEVYTDPNATIGQPFLLEPGMPVTVSGIDLLPYLQQNNLINPNGINLNQLPAGPINVWVDVIRESAGQQVLSTNNWGVINIAQHDPPQPFDFECGQVLDTNAMFHQLNWSPIQPMIIGNDVDIFYDVRIYHWASPENNTVFQGGWPLHTGVITSMAGANFIQISDFDVTFEVGETYVWTVTARVVSTTTNQEIPMVDNLGVSEPCTFVYGEAPTLADQLADGLELELFTSPSSERKGKAWWTVTDNTPNEGLSDFDEYFVEYRKQPTGNEGFEIPWFSAMLTDTSKFIYQLEPSTTYEVKVSGVIAGVVGDPTPVKTFTTNDPRVYNCGDSDLPFLPSTYDKLENATAGMQVQIGQFTMTMTEVNPIGAVGHYAGKGEIPIAFLAGAKAKVRFDDILIDTEFRVHEGRVDVITEGLESWLDDQLMQFIDPYFVDGTIDSAWVDTTAGVAWVMVDGNPQSFPFDPPNYPVIVNDENGNQYTIYPDGTIVVGTYLSISETWAATADEVIHFSQNEGEARGFDPKEHMEWYENYEVMELGDSSKYFVANKSLAKGEADKVNVEIPAGASATFELSDGTNVPATTLLGNWIGTPVHTGSTKMTLNIPARNNAGNYEIFAMVNNQKVGQLNVRVYSEKTKELVVVPIANNNLTPQQIEEELDNTLGEANIDIDVTIDSVWIDTSGTFTANTNISLPSEVGLLSKYSQEMRDLRDAYFEQHPNAPKNKYYLFIVNGFDDPSELGYMVRGRSMGFVKASQQNLLKTISHELGHGMGALEHTFKHPSFEKGDTKNLMDYSDNPPNLTKAQWKELRDLDIVPSMFDEIEDGSFINSQEYFYTLEDTSQITIYASVFSSQNVVGFYTPSGKFIKPTMGSISRWIFDPFSGGVTSFKLNNGEQYRAWFNQNSSEFVGYVQILPEKSLQDYIYDTVMISSNMDQAYADWFIENNDIALRGYFEAYIKGYPQAVWTNYSAASVGDRVTAAVHIQGSCNIDVASFVLTPGMNQVLNVAPFAQLKGDTIFPNTFVTCFLDGAMPYPNPIKGKVKPISNNSYNYSNYSVYNVLDAGTELLSLSEIAERINNGYDPVNYVVCSLLNAYEQTGEIPLFLIQTETPTAASIKTYWEENPTAFLYKLYASDVIENYGWDLFNEFIHDQNDDEGVILANYLVGRGYQEYASTKDLKNALNSAENLYEQLKKKIDDAKAYYNEVAQTFTQGEWSEKKAITLGFARDMSSQEIKEFLPLNIRYRMIRVMCSMQLWQNGFNYMEESFAVKLFKSIKDEQIIDYVEGLMTETIQYDGNTVPLFYAMLDNLDGNWGDFWNGKYADFVKDFSEILLKYYNLKGNTTLNFEDNAQSPYALTGYKFISSNNNLSGDYGGVSYDPGDILLSSSWNNANGNVEFSSYTIYSEVEHPNMAGGYHWTTYDYMQHNWEYHPFDFIALDFTNKEEISLLNAYSANEVAWFPAFLFKYLEDEQKDADNLRNLEVAVTIASMPFSAAAIVKAVKGGQYAYAFYEFADVTADVIALDPNTSSQTQALIASYNAIRLPFQIVKSVPDLKKDYIDGDDLKISNQHIQQFSDNYTSGRSGLNAADQKKVDRVSEYLDVANDLNFSLLQQLKNKFDGKPNVTLWLDEIKDNALLTKLDELPISKINRFETDINTLKSAFQGNPDLIDSWKKLSNFSPAIRTDLTNLNQRRILDEFANNIAAASNARKGNFGEIGADLDLNTKGYNSLIQRIDDIDANGHNGIDGIFEKNGEYFIVEGKYTGSATLNPANEATNLPRQMSDAWIQERLADAVGGDLAQDIIFQGYNRILAKVAPDGSVTYKFVSDTGYLNQGNGPLGNFIP